MRQDIASVNHTIAHSNGCWLNMSGGLARGNSHYSVMLGFHYSIDYADNMMKCKSIFTAEVENEFLCGLYIYTPLHDNCAGWLRTITLPCEITMRGID